MASVIFAFHAFLPSSRKVAKASEVHHPCSVLPIGGRIGTVVEARLAADAVLDAWDVGRAVQPDIKDTFEHPRRLRQAKL